MWISGFFRSGTSLTTRIVSELGYDLGPKEHLLKAKGNRSNWNPDGFYENYIFMDWSLSAFNAMNSWGHILPNTKKRASYSINSTSDKRFIYESIVLIHDDRISNKNKSRALRLYGPRNFDAYFRKEFIGKIAVKNPHFCVLHDVLVRYWPKSKFLIVFRNPDAAIKSAKKIADVIDYDLYLNYYSGLLSDHEQKKYLFHTII